MNGQNHRRKQSKSSPFYVVNLAKQLFHAKNISALIYLFLNIALIFGLFYWMDNSVVTGLVAAVVIYGVSAFVALSPVGEWFLRLSQDCRKFDPQRKKDIRILNRLEPLFFEVIERARGRILNWPLRMISIFILKMIRIPMPLPLADAPFA